MKHFESKPRDNPLDEWLSFEQESISRFKKVYPDLWKFFGDCINLARAVPFVLGHQAGLTQVEMQRLFLWQKMLHYQTQSLFLLLQSQLDAGFALLRLAAELSRDVSRIADDEKMLAIWLDRENKPNEYKKHFKFMLNSPEERAVHTIYKFASKFGVHGHQTDTMFGKVTGTLGESGSMLSWGVSDYGVLNAAHMWMMSFLPLHHIFAKSFMPKYFSIRPEIFLTLREYEVTMTRYIQIVSERLDILRELKK